MKTFKITLLVALAFTFTNCASGYKMIKPKSINYLSVNETNGLKLEYKYGLLDKKYEKKEEKKDVKLVAVKITNNSGKDVMFGRDIKLAYENGSEVYVLENEKTFTTLKQSTTSYLWYLLLTPMTFNVTKTDGYGVPQTTSSTPIGLAVGPGLTAGNMIAAGSANEKFKEELLKYNLNGVTIKNGETKYGLVGIKSDSFDALQLNVK